MGEVLEKKRNDMNPNIGMKRSTVLLYAIIVMAFWSSSFLILVEDFASMNAVVFISILIINDILFYAWVSLWLVFLGYNEDRRAGIPKGGD